jgi:hypothetical protein
MGANKPIEDIEATLLVWRAHTTMAAKAAKSL